MRLSTFSSNRSGQRLIRRLSRERGLHVAALTVLLLTTYVTVAPPPPQQDDYRPETLALLVSSKPADCVWAGDSRTDHLLEACKDVHGALLPARTNNFSFPLARFTNAYLEAISKQVDPDSHNPVIVLGITPLTLTQSSVSDGWFERLRWRQQWSTLFGFELPPPIRIDQLGQLRLPTVTADMVNESPPEPDWNAARERQFAWYRRTFARSQVSGARIKRLLEQVERWSGRGIRVYAMRPPISEEGARLEAQSGFDQGAFVSGFTAAGGLWIELPASGVPTLDGIHLTVPAAERVSLTIAEAIALGHPQARQVTSGHE